MFTLRAYLKRLVNEFRALKKSVSEWVIALDSKQYELQERVKELEGRTKQLEVKQMKQNGNTR